MKINSFELFLQKGLLPTNFPASCHKVRYLKSSEKLGQKLSNLQLLGLKNPDRSTNGAFQKYIHIQSHTAMNIVLEASEESESENENPIREQSVDLSILKLQQIQSQSKENFLKRKLKTMNLNLQDEEMIAL